MSKKYTKLLRNFRGKRILVIGDVILDRHIRGSVSRISPEAPVPVVLQQGEAVIAPGGAANVAGNLRALGARVTMVGRIGADPEGKDLLEGLRRHKIPARGIFIDRRIPTIVKTRIMAQHQQVLRLDREDTNEVMDERLLKKVINFLRQAMARTDAVIISDYGKGMITPPLIETINALARERNLIVTVDPKVENFAFYRGVTAITPNRSEAENAIRNIKITHSGRRRLSLDSDRLKTIADVERAGTQLVKFLELQSLLITLGEQGLCVFEKGKKPVRINTRAQDVFDVTGAGDTVIAVFTLALTAGATRLQAADLANTAAGIVVGKIGPVAVTADEIGDALKDHL